MTTDKHVRHILITSGPAVTRIDRVRRITNHSTGSLGSALTQRALEAGHQITLLRSDYCTAPAPDSGHQQIRFSDGHSLLSQLESLSRQKGNHFDAVWHAAAVSDYEVDYIADSEGNPLSAEQKLGSRSGSITLHLKPFLKIISRLKPLFPTAHLVGWKYETDGTRTDVIEKSREQIKSNQTHACVANGPAYGQGFAVCSASGVVNPAADATELTVELLGMMNTFHA